MKKNIFITISALLFILLLTYSCEQDISVTPPTTPVPLGSVIIQSEPKGAMIYEDGRISGILTPDTLNWLEEREYHFTLKKKFHKDTSFVMTALVDSSAKIFIDYYKNPSMLGNINISSTPTVTEVYLKNEYLGNTPLSMKQVKPGEFYYVFKKDNHRTDSVLVQIYSSRTSTAKMELTDTTYWVDYSDRTSEIHDFVLLSVAVDQNDVVWVGSFNGVSSFDGKNWKYYSTNNSGLGGMIINSIKVDKYNNKWFATDNGISKFDGYTWVNESKANSSTFPDNWVEDIEILDDGRKVIATKNGLGRSLDNGWNVSRFSAYADSNWITDVAVKGEEIWATHKNKGVLHLGTDREWDWYFYYPMNYDKVTDYNCVAIAEDAVWFGHKIEYYSAMTGLSSYINGKFDKSSYKALWGIDVYNISLKNGNEKWLSTRDGLFIFDNYNNRTFYSSYNTPLKENRIFDVAFDSKGDAWIATHGAGLYHFKVTKLK